MRVILHLLIRGRGTLGSPYDPLLFGLRVVLELVGSWICLTGLICYAFGVHCVGVLLYAYIEPIYYVIIVYLIINYSKKNVRM